MLGSMSRRRSAQAGQEPPPSIRFSLGGSPTDWPHWKQTTSCTDMVLSVSTAPPGGLSGSEPL